MPAPRRKILNIAKTDDLLKPRSAILEQAGYQVVPALTLLNLERACETQGDFDLVIIGSVLPRDEKRRAMTAVRKSCGDVPILELYQPGTEPVDEQAQEQLAGDEETALLAKVAEVIAKPRRRRRGAS